jgi:hypothetical protein
MDTEQHLPGTTPDPLPSLDELGSLRVAAKRVDTLSAASRRWLAQYIADSLHVGLTGSAGSVGEVER